jgi:hypothetical protein
MRRAEWILLLASWLSPFLLLGLAELAVRAFSDVDLLGNSEHLFVSERYGPSKGNAPNVEAMSFGQRVYTDQHGFRVPKAGLPGEERKRAAILVLGDSVAFGPAVEEEDTLAGLLRVRFPSTRIYNSAVIGYTTPDYRNLIEAFVPAHPEIEAAVLIYCLNDISSYSAQTIDRHLQERQGIAPEQELTETLRSFAPMSAANDFLRSRSKFYLLLRHRLLGTQLRDWKAVLPLYSEDRDADLAESVADIARMAAALEARGGRFVVVLTPFEYQLRNPEDPETQIPQRKLARLLEQARVDNVHARPNLVAGRASTHNFHAKDAAHLSGLGHRVMADVVTETLERPRRVTSPRGS